MLARERFVNGWLIPIAREGDLGDVPARDGYGNDVSSPDASWWDELDKVLVRFDGGGHVYVEDMPMAKD